MRIAIVGTGISGLVAAHHLHPDHDITVFEADGRIGGHTNTVEVDLDDGRFAVDTGFIVFNERTYPNFIALLDQLGVASQPSEMSFSVSDADSGIEYRTTNLSSIYAQWRNLVRPSFHRMLVDILRFNRTLSELVESGGHNTTSRDSQMEPLADFVARGRYSKAFVDHFLVPFGASIWSADPTTFMDFPVETYARFMANHGLLAVRNQPRWRTVSGGSATYIKALIAPFADRIRTATAVHKIVRNRDPGRDHGSAQVELVTDAGSEHFDKVVLATHSDTTLGLLGDPSPPEREILGAIRYQPNVATLHTDERFLPVTAKARAAWNFHVGAGDRTDATLTYWMNRLQSIPTSTPLLVTLNRHDEVNPDSVLRRIEYEHPVFDAAAIRAQRRRGEIQGVDGTYFAGAYWANGFHEDGVNSALDVIGSMRFESELEPV